jgi:hypothetical protein
MEPPKEPTAEQCSARAHLGGDYYAVWYPQMGGYAGKAVIQFTEHAPGGCIDLWVWHDGEFPFTDGDVDGFTYKPKRPAHLHHCDTDQFRKLADDIDTIEATRG